MKTSDYLASLSIIVSFMALIASCYPHIIDFKKRRRESLIRIKKLIYSSSWINEGDITVSYKTSFEIKFIETPGRTNILVLMCNSSKHGEVYIRGQMNPQGKIKAVLCLTVGWREIPCAEVTLTYDEDEDLLHYKFLHYLPKNGINDDLAAFDLDCLLWRPNGPSC